MSNLRNEMPEVAAFIDSVREAFGKEMIDVQIRKAVEKGESTFWARENGHRLGTRSTVHTSAIRWDENGIAYAVIPDWIVEAREYARKKGIEIKEASLDDLSALDLEAQELRKMIAAAKANAVKGTP